MARINKNSRVDKSFAYNVAKDIANLESEVEKLKNQKPTEQSKGIEFGNERVEFNHACFRNVLNSDIKCLQTGVFYNDVWYNDRPDDGDWVDMFTKKRYHRRNGIDTELVLPKFDIGMLERYALDPRVNLRSEKYTAQGFKAEVTIGFSISINDQVYDEESYPRDLIMRVKGYEDRQVLTKYQGGDVVSFGAELYVTLTSKEQYYEIEILNGVNVLFTKQVSFNFTNIDNYIRDVLVIIPPVKHQYFTDADDDQYYIGAPTFDNPFQMIDDSYLLTVLEYRLNGKVRKGIVEDFMYDDPSYIFIADTEEELQGTVEVWYKEERIK